MCWLFCKVGGFLLLITSHETDIVLIQFAFILFIYLFSKRHRILIYLILDSVSIIDFKNNNF